MIEAYSKKEITNTLYELKRDWGCSVEYHKIIEDIVNRATGVSTIEYDIFKIRRAILLPSALVREVTNTGLPFNYGGGHDSKSRFLYVVRKDLPKEYVANEDDYMVIKDVKYSFIKPIEDYDFDTVYIFKLQVSLPEKDVEA